MAVNITQEVENIRNATYARDVRNAMADSLAKMAGVAGDDETFERYVTEATNQYLQEHPDAVAPTDEQVNAWLDANGVTTGATAEQAAQIERNMQDIAVLSDALGVGTTADYTFIAGGISSDGTVNDSASNRVRSEDYIWAKAGSTIAVKPGSAETFNIATYSHTYTSSLLSYRGMSSDTFVVEQDCYIRFGITASDTSDPNAVASDTIDMHIIADTLPDVRAQVKQNAEDINNRLAWTKLCEAELLEASDSIMMSFQEDWVSEVFIRFYVAGDSDTVNPGIRVFVSSADGDFEMCNCECSEVSPDEELYIKTQGKRIGDSIDDVSAIVLALGAEEVVYSAYHGFTTWTNPMTVTLKPYVSDVKFAAESGGEIWGR